MRSRFVSFLTLALLPISLHAAVQNRISNTNIAVEGPAVVRGNVHPKALQSQDLGEANGNQVLDSLTLRFNLSTAQQAALDQLVADQQNPSSPRYHQWLTPEQFAQQFGLSSEDIAKVTSWLMTQGFTVTGVARSGTFVNFTGSVATAERAFHTSIHSLALNGEQHIGNLSDPALPQSIANITGSITGLSDFHVQARVKERIVPAPADTHAQAISPNFTSSTSGSHYIAPGDFYTIYDVNPLLTSSVNGSGVTIAVMGQTDISLTDAAAFRSASGLAANAPTVKLYGTDPGTSKNDILEAMLDVEWSGAAAPSASILYVNSKDIFDTSLVQAIDNNLAPIMTISYGDCESGFGSAGLNQFNQLFQQANAQGITILGPSGDSGATDCDYHATVATGGLAVDFPASSPFVTGVGGTMFNEGSGTYFNSTNGAFSGSAISYIPEAVWNETTSVGATDISAGGGGASIFFTKPSWQTGAGVPNDSSRDVPDLSLDAAFIHDGYLICSSGACVNGFRDSSGFLDTVGGTSVSTPAFAGILALVEQKIGSRLGNANPKIYALANSSFYNNVFHDVTVGSNSSPCKAGSPNCPSGGNIGYNATTGYDLASGWGSIDAFNLANDWNLVGSGSTGSTTGAAVSATTLTLSSSNTAAQCGTAAGTSYKFSVTVTGTAGTPTGSVQFSVDNAASGAPVTLSGGTAAFTLATAGLTSGVHTVTASYSGDTSYATSKGSYTIDLTSATAGDFSLTPCSNTATATAGGAAAPITYTLTSLNSFVGPITLSLSTDSASLNASYQFSVSPVTLTAGGTSTTALTIFAYRQSTSNGQVSPITTAKNITGDVPWFAAGSSAALAGLLLLTVPRKRRLPSLLAVLMLTAVAFGVGGCGSTTTAPNTTTTTTTTTNASPGSYVVTVTAAGTNSAGTHLVHNVTVNLTVQ